MKSKTPKVYKNKKLNQANFGNFNLSDYQVFISLVSNIGGVDEMGKYLQPHELQREHILTAKDFGANFSNDLSNSYKLLKGACKKLMKTSIVIEKPDLKETWEINVCSSAKYNSKMGKITVRFTDDIMPYLAQVREKFLLYNLKEVANFGSLYTTRLYELIQEFKETGCMVVSIEKLREIFAVGGKLKRYNDFKSRTFGHATKEINHFYDLNLRFEEIKKGRKVDAVKFKFNKTKVVQIFNHKSEESKKIYKKPRLLTQEKMKKGPVAKRKALPAERKKESSKSIGQIIKGLSFWTK